MTDSIIVDTVTRVCQDLCEPGVVNDAEEGKWPADLWNTLEESGLTLTWVSDELGGAGAEMADGFAVLKVAGAFATPVPLAETLMAGWLLAQAGMQVPMGPMTVAPAGPDQRITLKGGQLEGSARAVPFARNADHIVVLAREAGPVPEQEALVVAMVRAGACSIVPGTSLAGEPADDVSFDAVVPVSVEPAPAGLDEAALQGFGATVRAAQMAGALQRILDQSVEYALEREQFGRPIAKFQAIQHALAELAGEAAAAGAAADAAAEAVSAPDALTADGWSEAALAEIATAKVRVGEAATKGSAIAHQSHGAMGFTYEHSLHHRTRRLWTWRDEFGNEAEWSIRLGQMVAQRGADDLWAFVTGT
ncbi:MAG: acyl-CoA dehydrogenase [Alphaproteobacteria bacterium]|nr:acyl-CoA dehydrogenase [Alphaproteobacteria bacterium]MCB9928598.1 acyl-CoA dehydrogenase [Alphaproteobacteria bacterium]